MPILLVVFTSIYGQEPFILGADMSWIPEKESYNVKYADQGVVQDPLDILKQHRFNYIRLRLFVDPTAKINGEAETPYSAQGFCDLPHTIAMAKRVKAAGFKFLLDFHYSDTWADPKKQYKPVSWAVLSLNQLINKVKTYTKETLETFKKENVLPDMVQVGNEVIGGMIWPDGSTSNMANFASLMNAGIDGVKMVDSNIQIMVHSISERSPDTWLKNLKNAGVTRFDIFGLSYYSKWHGSPDTLAKILSEIVAHHTTKIIIVEYADNHERVNDLVFNIPGKKGLGTFVWEPTEWDESLFDWVNNRRETNARIDLFSKMSKKYGNDDLVGNGVVRPQIAAHNSNIRISYIDKRLYLKSLSNLPARVSLFTISGKKLYSTVISAGGDKTVALDDLTPCHISVNVVTIECNGVRDVVKCTLSQ
jgi:arabinogalactan endo-1,4-beta-galactosidase